MQRIAWVTFIVSTVLAAASAVAGLTAHRIPYAIAGGQSRSLLILIADSIATLRRCVRVGEGNRFAWTPDWFLPLGVPVLGAGGDAGRPMPDSGPLR